MGFEWGIGDWRTVLLTPGFGDLAVIDVDLLQDYEEELLVFLGIPLLGHGGGVR